MNLRWGLLIFVLVILDQISKFWVEASLPLYERVPFIPFLSFFRTYNEGVAFSAFADLGPLPLIIMTSAIIAFVFWLWWGLEKGRVLSSFGYALVLAGAFGNLIDRIRLGKVVDMLSFHIDTIGFQFAIFNLADTFITVGAVAILLDEFKFWRSSVKT